jgi:serine acetyltransferase
MVSAVTGKTPDLPEPEQWDPNGRWGLDPRRRNRPSIKVFLAVLGLRGRNYPSRPVRLVLQSLERALGTAIGLDFRATHVGPGLFLPHPFGIVVHARVRMGSGVTLYQGVTIGEDDVRPGVPILGDDVVVGANAAVLGPIRIGDGALIGAGAVVLTDVPAGAVAVGVPAVVRYRRDHHR